MTQDALLILGLLFGPIWSLFTSWEIPGTHMTPAEWGFFLLTVSFLFRFIKRASGSDGGSK